MAAYRIVAALLDPAGSHEIMEKLLTLLRDAGAEVVYVGSDLRPEELVAAAIQEDTATVIIAGVDVNASAAYAREIAAGLKVQSTSEPFVVVAGPWDKDRISCVSCEPGEGSVVVATTLEQAKREITRRGRKEG